MVNGISGASGQAIGGVAKGNCSPCTGCGDCGNPKITTLAQMLKDTNAMKKPEELFKQLSLQAGGDGTAVTKDQLQTLLDKLTKDGKDPKMIQDLIANFDKIANGKDSITAADVKAAVQNGILKPPHRNGEVKPDGDDNKGFQDPSTITKEQLEPPIDLRV
ncbi:MAG: hypothetical protein WCF95_05470 [bacterium]